MYPAWYICCWIKDVRCGSLIVHTYTTQAKSEVLNNAIPFPFLVGRGPQDNTTAHAMHWYIFPRPSNASICHLLGGFQNLRSIITTQTFRHCEWAVILCSSSSTRSEVPYLQTSTWCHFYPWILPDLPPHYNVLQVTNYWCMLEDLGTRILWWRFSHSYVAVPQGIVACIFVAIFFLYKYYRSERRTASLRKRWAHRMVVYMMHCFLFRIFPVLITFNIK